MSEILDLQVFGQRLRSARLEGKCQQQELAQRLGVAASWISDLERGKQSGLAAETVKRLAQALGCTSDYLLGLTDDPQPRRRRRPAKADDADTEEAA